jgi:hypothetical protein
VRGLSFEVNGKKRDRHPAGTQLVVGASLEISRRLPESKLHGDLALETLVIGEQAEEDSSSDR